MSQIITNTSQIVSQKVSHHKSGHTTNLPLQSSLDHRMGCTDRRRMHEITDHTTTLLLHTHHKSHESHHDSPTAYIIPSSHCRVLIQGTGKLWYVWLLALREYPSHRQHHVFISPAWPEHTKDKTTQHALTPKVVNDVCMHACRSRALPGFHSSSHHTSYHTTHCKAHHKSQFTHNSPAVNIVASSHCFH